MRVELSGNSPLVTFDARCPVCGKLITSRTFNAENITADMAEQTTAAGEQDALTMMAHLEAEHGADVNWEALLDDVRTTQGDDNGR